MCRLGPPKGIAGSGDGLLPASLDDVRIQVERRARNGVTEAALHGDDIAAARDRPRRERMTQRVQRHFGRQLAASATSRKAFEGASSLIRAPVLIRKDEALVEVIPRLRRKLLGRLGGLYTSKNCNRIAIERHLSALSRLRPFEYDGGCSGRTFRLLCPCRCEGRTDSQCTQRQDQQHSISSRRARRARAGQCSDSEERLRTSILGRRPKNLPASSSDSARVSASFTFGAFARRKILAPMKSSSTAHSKARCKTRCRCRTVRGSRGFRFPRGSRCKVA